MERSGAASRRALLRFLLASPLLLAPRRASALERLLAALTQVSAGPPAEETRTLLRSASDAVDVFDFEAVARHNLSPAHYTFLSMGVHDEATLKANREAFAKVQLRPRRLVDVRDLDTSRELLGERLSCPIILAPAGSQKAFHPDAELAVARAARRKDHLQILSQGSSSELTDVIEARDAPVWFQIYTPRFWPVTRTLLRRAERAGCPAVVLTVDLTGAPFGQNRDAIRRFHRADNPECQSCHSSTGERVLRGAGAAAGALGFDLDDALADTMVLDWDYVDRVRDATSLKLVVKGILTGEDANLCVEHGADALIVSNHGGRAEDSGLSTIEVLPEVARAVAGRIPVLIDSGFRRGEDAFKALALGASAICFGRPYLWGLAAFGQEGVEAVLAILRRELETVMKQMGTPSLVAITPEHVRATD